MERSLKIPPVKRVVPNVPKSPFVPGAAPKIPSRHQITPSAQSL